MKASHIILKVKDLDEAVAEYRKKGFTVEYGKTKNPYNAIIYFSEGPYFEILARTGMPKFIKSLFRLFGKKGIVDRLDYWDNHPGGYCGFCIENYRDNFDEERAILDKHGIKSVQMNSHRLDTFGRDLRFSILIPEATDIPFLMTYFSIDPKPKGFVHENGIKSIKKVIYKTNSDKIPIIRELCDDERLILEVGEGIEVEFEK